MVKVPNCSCDMPKCWINVGPILKDPQGTSHQHLKGGEGMREKNTQKLECLLRFNIERMKYMAIMNYNHGFFINCTAVRNVHSYIYLSIYLSIYMCSYSLLLEKGTIHYQRYVFFRMTPCIALDDFTSTPSHGKVTENPPKAMPRVWAMLLTPIEKY